MVTLQRPGPEGMEALAKRAAEAHAAAVIGYLSRRAPEGDAQELLRAVLRQYQTGGKCGGKGVK